MPVTAKVVLFVSLFIILSNAQSCLLIQPAEYTCTFVDANPNLAVANDIQITVYDEETFFVNSDNPDCSPYDRGTLYYDDLSEGLIYMRISGSCSGPVSLFNNNDDSDVLTDFTINCDSFSGTVYTSTSLLNLKGDLSCVAEGPVDLPYSELTSFFSPDPVFYNPSSSSVFFFPSNVFISYYYYEESSKYNSYSFSPLTFFSDSSRNSPSSSSSSNDSSATSVVINLSLLLSFVFMMI